MCKGYMNFPLRAFQAPRVLTRNYNLKPADETQFTQKLPIIIVSYKILYHADSSKMA